MSNLEWQESKWNRLNREKQMMSDTSRLVRLGAIAQWRVASTATCPYCQVVREAYDAP
jgi:hypothetical protein